jgi:flagellar protein FlbD
VIRLTRLNGTELALNPDLIHRAEETPDTVLTLIDGSRYVVVEPIEELIERIVGYRARVVAAAGLLGDGEPAGSTGAPHDAAARRGQGRGQGATGAHDDAHDDAPDDDRRAGASVVRLRARRA